jgi:ABC-type transport system substrate-binding protein
MVKASSFDMNIQLVDPTQLTPDTYGNPAKGDCGKNAATVHVAAITSPDPDQVLRMRFLKTAARNVGCFEPAGLGDLALQGASLTDPAQRKPLYEKVWALLREQAADDFPLWFNTSITVTRDWVGGLRAPMSDYSLTTRGLWISKGKVPVPESEVDPPN